jgi:hypothetical protein
MQLWERRGLTSPITTIPTCFEVVVHKYGGEENQIKPEGPR